MDRAKIEQSKKIIENSFLKQFIEDDNITDITFNGDKTIVVHNQKGPYLAPYQPTLEEIKSLVKRIADIQEKEITDTTPILNTEFDVFRVSAVHEVVSPYGMTMAFRVSKPKRRINDLSEIANKDVAKLLEVLIKAGNNLIISGQVGSGKTEVQKTLVGHIPNEKKIIVIEDTMDSRLKELYPDKDISSWVVKTESRENPIYYRDLIKVALRHNPDWLIVAETRGSEAYDMVEAALTDHLIVTTLHAKGAHAILSRLLSMIGQEYSINPLLWGKDIVQNIKFGIHMAKESTKQGVKRYIKQIVEYTDFNEDGPRYKNLYQVRKIYDPATKQYREEETYESLSEGSLIQIQDKQLYHEVPEIFIP